MIDFDVDRVERDLGLVVRELRIKRDYSQRELADRAGVGLTALRSLEKGKGSTLATLSKVVHALGRDSWLGMLDDATAVPKPLKKKKKKKKSSAAGQPDSPEALAALAAEEVAENKRRRVAKRGKPSKADGGKAEAPAADAPHAEGPPAA